MNIKTGLSQWLDLIKNHITEATTTVTMLAGVLIGVTGVSSLPQTTSLLLVVVSTILLPGKWWPHITQQADLLLIKPTSQPLNWWQRLMDPFQATARKSYKLPLRNRRLEGLLLLIIFLGTSAFSLSRAPGVKAEIFPSSSPGEITACKGDGAPQALLVIIAEFDEKTTSLNLEDHLYQTLASQSQWIGRIRVCRTGKTITDQPEAYELGKEAKAAIVIWGQSDEAIYEVNIEIAEWDLPEFEWRPFPVEEAKSSEFQTNEPLRTSFYTQAILSDLLYLRGDILDAREMLSLSLNSEEIVKLRRNPGNETDLANAYFLLGYYYDFSSTIDPDLNLAIKYYSQALEIDNSFFAAYINRGKAYEHIGKPEKAMDDYESAVALTRDSSPDLAFASLINLALLYVDVDQSIADKYFSEAINLNPVRGYTQRGLARLFRWKQPDAAIKDFLDALDLEKSDPYLYHFLGQAQLINNQPEDAVNAYKKAISIAKWTEGDRDAIIDDLRILAQEWPEQEVAVESIVKLLKSAGLP